jgi:hypothetical protein
MQDLLDAKAATCSKSIVAHLRWYLNAIFKLAVSDGLLVRSQPRCRTAHSSQLQAGPGNAGDD